MSLPLVTVVWVKVVKVFAAAVLVALAASCSSSRSSGWVPVEVPPVQVPDFGGELRAEGGSSPEVSFVSGASGERRVSAVVTRPAGVQSGCVLALHGLGGSVQEVSGVAALAASQGWLTIAPSLSWGKGFSDRLAEGTAEGTAEVDLLADALGDARRSLDWLDSFGGCGGVVVLVGVSLGGMAGVSLMEADRRIDAGVFIVSGGTFAAALTQVGLPELDLSPWDPVGHLAGLEGRPVLVVNARDDEIVPADDAKRFHAALGDVVGSELQVVWVPGGHLPTPEATVQIAAAAVPFLDQVVP